MNYDEQRLEARYHTVRSAQRGTDIHAFAHEAIRLGIKISKGELSLSTYVNDAIGYRMLCEQPLYYSPNCFGCPDTIQFRRRKLRIHDLKTGITKTSMNQLKIYAAIFCLEYKVDPFEIEIELRIYQREEIVVLEPSPEEIIEIMEKIVEFDQEIERIKEAGW